MNVGRTPITQISGPHRRQVDGYDINAAFQYNTGWSLTVIDPHRVLHHYWLDADGKFHTLKTHINDGHTGDLTQEIGDVVEPDEELVAAVKKAINYWMNGIET